MAPRPATAVLLFASVVGTFATIGAAEPPAPRPDGGGPGAPAAQNPAKAGVVLSNPAAYAGYTLVFPLNSTNTYLIDMQGRIVQTWKSKYACGQEAYLLENGHLLRPCNLSDDEAFFAGASKGGRIQEFTWDGQLVWDYKFHNPKQIRHHAVTRMPNGNIMMIVWERKAAKEYIDAGVKPDLAGAGETLVDSLYEVKPTGKTAGQIVWEWHLFDHLIQDYDKAKANYGDVAAHPELADANFGHNGFFGGPMPFGPPNGPPPQAQQAADKPKGNDSNPGNPDVQRLRGLGYVGAGGGRPQFAGMIPDWTHVNAVAYNAKFDQIMISVREFGEVWILDHSTTSAQAAGHTGGKYGKGGDILYRWGNPRAYRAGAEADQRLFAQHDAQWITAGLSGEGHLLVFNNGNGRPDGNYSSVDEVVLPVDADGNYAKEPGKAFGPNEAIWSYSSPDDFSAPFMAGAQRLPNGNTLVCTGFSGQIFEVTPAKQVVWRYVAPMDPGIQPGGFGPPGRFGPPGGPPRAVELWPAPLSFFVLQLNDDQRKQLNSFEDAAAAKIEKVLTAEQLKQWKERPRGPGGPGGPPEIGSVLPKPVREMLKLTEDQTKQIDELQKQADAKVSEVLTDDQKTRLKQIPDMMKQFMAGGGPRGGPGGPPGRGPRVVFGGPPGGPGGFGGNGLFRAYRYGLDYPGLANKDLTPGKKIEELPKKDEPKQ